MGRSVEVDLGMGSCWQCLPTGTQIPVASAPWIPWSKPQERVGHCEEASSLSTEAPLLQDVCGSSSDDGESSLALQAEEIRAEEERALSSALHPSQEAWTVKNTFIDVSPSMATSAKRRMRSVPRDMFSRKNVQVVLCYRASM